MLVILFCLLFFVTTAFSEEYKNYLIPIPDYCVYISKVEPGKVFLKKTKGDNCQKISLLQVSVEPNKDGDVEIYYEGELWKKVKVRGTLDKVVETLFDLSLSSFYDEASRLVVGSNMSEEQKKLTEQKLDNIKGYIKSEEFQKKVVEEKYRILDLLTLDKNYPYDLEKLKEKSKGEKLFSNDEKLYIFISESVPIDLIKLYAYQVSLINDENIFFVLRGALGGLTYIRPTVEWIYSIIEKDKNCNPLERECEYYDIVFQIDPFLFRKYGINVVPAIVYVKGDLSYVSFGDADLFSHLYEIGKASNNQRIVNFVKEFLIY